MALKKQTIRKSALTPTALISGGAGFIGSHLAEYLLGNNARVVVLDNYNTGKDIHIKHLLNNPNFAFYNVDINTSLPSEIESVDYIFHLAGLEEYLFSKEFINLEALFTNSLGTKNLLDLAKSSNAKFLLASTVDVYQGKMSQLDLTNYFGNNNYDSNKFSLTEAKRFAEAIVWEYFKKYAMDARIVRLPEVYGPRMNLEASGSLGNYLKSIIEGYDVTVYGDGFEKEYYLYINDAVQGLIKSQFSANTQGNIYSLVPELPISALELGYLVKKFADREVNIQFKPKAVENNLQVKIPDPYNLKDIDWKPKTDLKQGIVKTLEWFGYSPNSHSFKPAKLIEQKIQAGQSSANITGVIIAPKVNEINRISSLLEPAPVIKDLEPKTGFNPRPKFKIKLPQIKLPNIKLPRVSFGFKTTLALKIFAVVFSAFMVFVAFPVGGVVVNARNGYKSLLKVKDSVQGFNSSLAAKESNKAYTSFRNAKKSLSGLRWAFTVFSKKDTFYSFDRMLSSLSNFSKAFSGIDAVIKPTETMISALRPDNEAVANAETLESAKLEISKAQNYIKLAQADFSGVAKNTLPMSIQHTYDEYKDKLEQSAFSLDLVSGIILGLPNVLGASGERNYIIWFQNSNEIRPTGGFIGSYGLLKLDKGKIKDLSIDDIYNPDGQVDVRNINVLAPKPITDFLAEKKLYLRNSNWSPDFPTSVKTFDDLYFKIDGKKIDGYIALDLSFVKSLLKVIGPVYLAAYNEEITSDNLYERTQFHSDFNYENGSTQKRSFLTILGSKVIEKLLDLPKDKFVELLSSVGDSMSERHFMIHLRNDHLSTLLNQMKWDGALVPTAYDYLNVVNANLGGTKANYYVTNKMSYEVNSMTRDGLLRGVLYLDYEHTGKDGAWPSGPYKNYVRVLTQAGSNLTGARIITGGSEQDIFKQIVISKEGSYNSFEANFVLPPTQKLRLVITYDLPPTLSVTKDNHQYRLYWQKQPGTQGDLYTFSFNAPFGMKVLSQSGETQGVMNHDLDYFINLQ